MNKFSMVLLFSGFLSFSYADEVPWETYCGKIVVIELEGEGGSIPEKSLEEHNPRTGALRYFTPGVDNSNSEEAEITALRAYQNEAIDKMVVGARYCITGVRGAEGAHGPHFHAHFLNFHTVQRQ